MYTIRFRRLLTVAMLVLSTHALAGQGDVVQVAAVTVAAQEPSTPAGVAVVPLPPAVGGVGVSVILMIALRYSRHRRWLTLR